MASFNIKDTHLFNNDKACLPISPPSLCGGLGLLHCLVDRFFLFFSGGGCLE
jgi:hypothetical protein